MVKFKDEPSAKLIDVKNVIVDKDKDELVYTEAELE